MEALNRELFLEINRLAGNPLFDVLNEFIAQWAPYCFAAALLVFFVRGRKIPALHALYASLFGLLVNWAIGLVYFHPRPFMVGLGRTLLPHVPETSFPSDHATLVFSIAFSFLLSAEYRAGSVLIPAAVLNSFSRVYTGVHFPFDIAGSLLVGLSAATMVRSLAMPLSPLDQAICRLYDRRIGFPGGGGRRGKRPASPNASRKTGSQEMRDPR
jgi:undecaprenyl-diphosphatase